MIMKVYLGVYRDLGVQGYFGGGTVLFMCLGIFPRVFFSLFSSVPVSLQT